MKIDGASLVYTSNSVPNSLPTLVHSMLGIQSPLKRQLVKHNVVDRDKVLIPPNWDSWGKIRVLREGFNVEAISNGWGQEFEDTTKSNDNDRQIITIGKADIYPDNQGPLVLAYEEIISDPKKNSATDVKNLSNQGLELETLGMQEFLAGQLEIMEQLKSQEEHGEGKKDPRANTALSSSRVPHDLAANESNRVNEHIGPVQFNIGGIQVDAEDMLKRLKDRKREDTPDREGAAPATPEGKSQNEALANFFAGLMKKGGTNSPRQHVS
jgi:dynein light intermediate chain 1